MMNTSRRDVWNLKQWISTYRGKLERLKVKDIWSSQLIKTPLHDKSRLAYPSFRNLALSLSCPWQTSLVAHFFNLHILFTTFQGKHEPMNIVFTNDLFFFSWFILQQKFFKKKNALASVYISCHLAEYLGFHFSK